jgi:hypothetical protein
MTNEVVGVFVRFPYSLGRMERREHNTVDVNPVFIQF